MMAKKIDKTTKIKHRFGNFELRVSDVKVEIENVANRSKKCTYANGCYEYGLIVYLLSETFPAGDGVKTRTKDEVEEGVKLVEHLVYMMVYTELIFSDAEFRNKYYDLVTEFVQRERPISDEDDQKILDELRSEHEAKEILKDDLESEN